MSYYYGTPMRLKESSTRNLTPIVAPQPSPQKVTIVIAGRNSGKYLRDTINSAFNQTVPCEIIYCDDCSTDHSLWVAKEYFDTPLPAGCTFSISPSGVHQGVCPTRNRGALAATNPYIIFLDADDVLTPTYVADMLSDVVPGTPFVYPSCHAFQGMTNKWSNLAWDQYDKWNRNQVSTTAMWDRTIFIAAGLWQGDIPTMWDYDLALRCSRFGTPIAGKAILNYRIHDTSVSSQLNERTETAFIEYAEMIRRKDASLGVGCLVSGRLPELFPKWIDAVACSVRYAKLKPSLFLLLHNEAHKNLSYYMEWVSKFSDSFSTIQVTTLNRPSPQNVKDNTIKDGDITYYIDVQVELARRDFVSTLLADSCQMMQDRLNTDIVWLIEDDIIIPMKAASLLYHELTLGAETPIGVSGCYSNRHEPTKWIGGWIQHGKHYEPTYAFGPADDVDFVGTGCLMYWAKRLGSPKKWRNKSKIEDAFAHDWAWSEDVKGTLRMIGTVQCDHHISLEESV